MKSSIKIIGCGVSGLSVGITLLDDGFDVEIITEKLPKDTTSSKAAAIWFPYEVKPFEKASKWSRESYYKFLEFCDVSNSGVSIVPLTVLVNEETDTWWTDSLPQDKIRKAPPDELPDKFPNGFIMHVPLIETQIYLDFLLEKFQTLGGKLNIQKISSFEEFIESNTILVNCTGLGSRELFNDNELYSIYGQIVKAEFQPGIKCISAEFTFDDAGHQLAYVVARKDCLVLGGTAIKAKEDLKADPEISKGIIERCKEIESQLCDVKIISDEVGLRPGRSEIRLEREGNIIHNYGHGGGGFTVSWGCAFEVRRLLRK